MNLQIDTIKKTIRLEQSVKFSELIKDLDMLFPNDSWKEYTLEFGIQMPWVQPIIIREPIPWVYPNRPFWEQPLITHLLDVDNQTTKYNIQM